MTDEDPNISDTSTIPALEARAYEDVISALRRLVPNWLKRSQAISGTKPLPTLQQVALDLENAEILPSGTPFGLQKLNETERFFVQNTTQRSLFIPEMKRKVEILDGSGQGILVGIEETSFFTNAFSYASLQDFDFRFIDPNNGLEAFRVSSRSRLISHFGTVISVLHENQILGRVIHSGHYDSTVFKLLSRSGRLMYIIKPDDDYVEGIRPSFLQRLTASEDIDIEFPTEFNIWSSDESVFVGRMAGNWNIHDKQEGVVEHLSESESDESLSDDEQISPEESEESPTSDEEEDQLSSSTSLLKVSVSVPKIQSKPEFDEAAVDSQNCCIPFQCFGKDTILKEISNRARKHRRISNRRFNVERYRRFLESIGRRVNYWEWYFEGENFGVEFKSELGPISRAMLIAVLLIQYFRLHSDRHHRRKSWRSLFRTKFRRWCISSGGFLLVAMFIIILDIVRDQPPF